MKVRWSAEANLDRVAIFDYIELDSPRAAARVDARILQGIATITQFPEIGRQGRVRSTREFVIAATPYLIIYRVQSTEVLILRIRHGAQKLPG